MEIEYKWRSSMGGPQRLRPVVKKDLTSMAHYIMAEKVMGLVGLVYRGEDRSKKSVESATQEYGKTLISFCDGVNKLGRVIADESEMPFSEVDILAYDHLLRKYANEAIIVRDQVEE